MSDPHLHDVDAPDDDDDDDESDDRWYAEELRDAEQVEAESER